jgi:anti-sigma-K factor RskA
MYVGERAVASSENHDELSEQAAAYALGVLSAEERIKFEGHLSSCDECAAEVRSYGQVVAALAHAAPSVVTPVNARSRVLARIAHATPSGLAAPSVQAPLQIEEHRTAGTTAGAVKRAAAPARTPWLLAAASVALAAGLGGYVISQRTHIGRLEQRVRDETSRADVAEQQAAAARSAATLAAADERTVVVVLAASDLVRVELAGQPVAPQASARAFWSRSRGLVFTASNLPPLPAGRTYQLWFVTPDMPVDAGLLKPKLDGGVNVVYAMPSGITKPVAIAVTIEPEGGVPAPTGDKYLVGLVN